MKSRHIPILILVVLTQLLWITCTPPKKDVALSEGIWRAVLNVQGHELLFNFRLVKEGNAYIAELYNDQESILLDEISIEGDTLIMRMHIFDADIKARIGEQVLNGYWKKNYLDDYVVPFTAVYGDTIRFDPGEPAFDFSGKWKVKFSDEKVDSIYSVGIFNQAPDGHVTGTFLNAMGDYRTLEGQVVGSTLQLSTFDGGHAFLFKAEPDSSGQLKGDFWSGMSFYESWTAIRDENASIPDENKLTFLKEGYDNIEFEFPDLEGNLVSLDDEQFKDQVVILQIFGTWCPNYMDETKFLSQWYNENQDLDVKILGLAYEAKDDFEYASSRVRKMKKKLGVNYDFVIAGNKDKEKAAETLPMLNHILAFPTTIFIDKQGEIRRIHTGFTGPGTGVYFENYVTDFEEFVGKLAAE